MTASGAACFMQQSHRKTNLWTWNTPDRSRALPAAAASSRIGRQRQRSTYITARSPGRGASSASTTNGASSASSSSRAAKQRQLARLLLEQARKEVWGGWLSDLLLPLVTDDAGSRHPPPRVLPTEALVDEDSKFVVVDGVRLHYKESWPASGAQQAAAPGSSSGSYNGNGNGSSKGSSGSDGSRYTSSGNGASGHRQAVQRTALGRPALLLVHGLNGSTFNWRDTAQPLADATGCRVISFDRPPFGLAERPLEWGKPGQPLQYNPYSLEGSARLAEGLLDALGVQQVVAMGHSAGALVCTELALRQPQRVAGLVYIAPALPTTPQNSFTRRANLGQQLRFLLTRGLLADDTWGLRYVRRQILKRRDEVAAGNLGTHPQDVEVPQDVIDGYLKPLQAGDWDRGVLLFYRAFSLPPAYDYDALTQPVFILQGSNDGMLSQNARDLNVMLQQRPQGSTQFVELQGIGHVPMDECQQEVNSLLTAFVQQQVLEVQAGQQGPAGGRAYAG